MTLPSKAPVQKKTHASFAVGMEIFEPPNHPNPKPKTTPQALNPKSTAPSLFFDPALAQVFFLCLDNLSEGAGPTSGGCLEYSGPGLKTKGFNVKKAVLRLGNSIASGSL